MVESLWSLYQSPGGCGEEGKEGKKDTSMIRKVNAGGEAQLLVIKGASRLTCRAAAALDTVTHGRLKGFGLKPGAPPGAASSFMRR